MEEPSVLDYFKAKLTPWKGAPVVLPPVEAAQPAEAVPGSQAPPAEAHLVHRRTAAWPWRSLLALFLAIAGQLALQPPDRAPVLGAILLALAIIWVLWASIQEGWQLAARPQSEREQAPSMLLRPSWLAAGGLLALITFLTSGGNRFTFLNLLALGLSLAFLLATLWVRPVDFLARNGDRKLSLLRPYWEVRISRWSLVLMAATALVLFFRFYQLDGVPPEMVSDHAEKYLDVRDVLEGETRIFFPRNGGREALQFYLLAGLHRYFGADLDFLTLKLSTALIGLLSLPFVYLLGKEVANRRVGLLAFTFAGISYWTNVVSRAGMRLPFYLLFTASTLYFLARGLRTSRRNDFILAGLSLGLSFYGYSADRILPLVVIAAVGLFLLHAQSKGCRQATIGRFSILVLFSLVVFLPLLRYVLQDPQGFSHRMATRMGATEVVVQGSMLQVFLENLWRALAMFSWSGGVVWGVSIPETPALEVISGALFYLGAALLFVRYLRRRHWLDLFLLVSIPLLMLPSILALAFPSENPNLYRTGGAMVPVFLMVALALDGLMHTFETHLSPPVGRRAAWIAALALVGLSSLQSYDRVFNQYLRQYSLSAWNTSEMGTAIQDFANTAGSLDNAWVMGYPHWADTRLVAIQAGVPFKDFALFPEQLDQTQRIQGAKLFILNPQDYIAMDALLTSYPQGWLQTYTSKVETKDFLMYFVPPSP